MGKCFHQFRWEDRVRLEILNRAGHSKKEIAQQLGFHISTIYRELKRGETTCMDYEYRYVKTYAPKVGQDVHDYNASSKGAPLKLGNNYALEEDIENMVLNMHYSPAAVAAVLSANPQHGTLCEATIYRYAKRGYFGRVTTKDFPEHGVRKHPYQKVKRTKKNKTKLGTSIEQRPQQINDRLEWGHWEMDCVEGKQGTKGTFLVLTERVYCTEIVLKLPRHTAACVVETLDKLEKSIGKRTFKQIFKSITMDNGSEFADSPRIEYGPTGKRRTTCYYCHPQAPTERPNNERQNKFIRRRYPKGQSLTPVKQQECTALSAWINTYPVQSLNWKTPAQCFIESCRKEGIKINAYLAQFLAGPTPTKAAPRTTDKLHP